jgi:NAD(P)-dependent dehydrogenase (short-subunit alcohol dehydrogenase family)
MKMAAGIAVIVTGASRGIGAAVSRWLGRAKAGVILTARSENALQRVADEVRQFGGTSEICAGDISDPKHCDSLIRKALDRFHHLDALVNNAGIIEPLSSIADSDPEEWRRNMEVNLYGPYSLIKAAIPALRSRKGRIINISSGAAFHPIHSAGAYCVSKAALNQLNKIVAKEEPNITCVAVRPGVVDTSMQERIRKNGPAVMPEDEISYYLTLKRDGVLKPPDVPACSIAWLAISAPKELSGQFMDYDDPRITRPTREFFGIVI